MDWCSLFFSLSFFLFLLPEMLQLLLISTLPAFTLMLVAPAATHKHCKLVRELGLVALLLVRELLHHSASAACAWGGEGGGSSNKERERERGVRIMPSKAKPEPALAAREEGEEGTEAELNAAALPLLDLPELALERVLEELEPPSLAAMACVCVALRDRCSADTLWGRHVNRKWGRVLGAAARKEWEAELAARRSSGALPRPARRRSLADSLACAWPFSWITCRWLKGNAVAAEPAAATPSPLPSPATDTVAAWYRAVECGEFSFPAQVYNREVKI